MLKRAVLKTKSEQPIYSEGTIHAMLNIFFNQMTTLNNRFNYKGFGHFEVKNKKKRKDTYMQLGDDLYAYKVFERKCIGRECLLLGLHLKWQNNNKIKRSEDAYPSCLWFAREQCKSKELIFKWKLYSERKLAGWKFV